MSDEPTTITFFDKPRYLRDLRQIQMGHSAQIATFGYCSGVSIWNYDPSDWARDGAIMEVRKCSVCEKDNA